VLVEMLNADAAVKAIIRIGWNKFRQLVPLLINKDVWAYVATRCLDEEIYV